ncbi:MAG: DMT family transporter [Rhodobacteraceae bacterium]|nr:DMT family transporter [Paracoccaceae bacterium]
MELWIPITIGAALAQTVRFMVQKLLAGGPLSAGGATLARFVYSAPLVAALLVVYLLASGAPLPPIGPGFWPYALIGGAAQILATMAVVALFSHRSFAIGITFKKTEVMLTALAGFVVLGDRVSAGGALAIGVGFLGVLALMRSGTGAAGLALRSAGLGLGSGVFFAISAVGYRGAVLALETDDLALRAGVTLAIVTTFQSAALGAWLVWREPGQIAALFRAWRAGALVGLFSMLGSLGWFAAFALQSAAYVFALGQVELVFSALAARWVFSERISAREYLGMALIAGSAVVLIAAA